MKRLSTAMLLILSASPSFAGSLDEDCYLIDMGGYFNLSLACDRGKDRDDRISTPADDDDDGGSDDDDGSDDDGAGDDDDQGGGDDGGDCDHEDDGHDNNGHGNGDEGDCKGAGCDDPDNPGNGPKN